MITDFDPDTNPDPGSKPVEFSAANPKKMAPPPDVNPNGEYMGVNEARQAAIMRAGYTPAPAPGGPRPADTPHEIDAYQDVAQIRNNALANYESPESPLNDIELADMTASSGQKKNPGGGVGAGTGEKGFWTTGKIIFAVVAGTLVLSGIGLGIAGGLGAFAGSGGGGGSTKKKAPTTRPVALTDQPAGKVEIDILGGKDAQGESWVVAGDGTLSGSGVRFKVGMDTKTAFKVDGEGDWAIDATSGRITFTPSAGFTGSPTPVNYFVVDSNNMQSGNAAISIAYKASGGMTTSPVNPTVADITLADQVPGTITIDILGGKDANGVPYVSKGSGALKGNGVFLVSTEGIAQKLPVTGEGVWAVDNTTGKITFTPDAGFLRAPTAVRFLVRDDSTKPLASNEGRIVVSFKAGPVAVSDVDGAFARLQPTDTVSVTVDILANDIVKAAPIDPKSVRLERAIASDPAYMPTVTIAVDGKSADVSGEGTWTVDPVTGKMTFVALQGFNGQTTIVTYTVADTSGIRSNEAWVQLNSEIKAVTDALQKLVNGSDAAFWTVYKTQVIDDPAVSIREALVVTSLFTDIFDRALSPLLRAGLDTPGSLKPGRVLGTEFSGYEMRWLTAKATKDELWAIMQDVQTSRYKGGYPEASFKGVTRFICADVMVRLLRVIVGSMNKMQQ